MESVLSFILILGVYFLGSLSITQSFIRPISLNDKGEIIASNHMKILGISLGSAIPPTLLLFSVLVI